MTTLNTSSNAMKALVLNLLSTHTYKMALMVPTFEFDNALHSGWADVSSGEIAAGNGYVAGGQELTNMVVTRDDVLNKAVASFDPVRWDASGGPIADTGSAIIYDSTDVDQTIAGPSDFGLTYSTPSGEYIQFTTVQFLVA